MDTITHGIAGALIGKGLFSERWGPAATFTVVLASVFPDCDVVAEVITGNPLSLLKYHRGITHSFVAMPFFALLLAAVVWWFAKRRGMRVPFWPLALAALAGIGTHILFDGLTSFGTRMWEPISWVRVSWDWLFIVDPTLTALLLVPQVAAWVQNDRAKAPWRALGMWGLFTILASLTWGAEQSVGGQVPFAMVPVAGVVLAAVFFLPLVSGGLFEWSRREWCLAGLVLAVAYIGLCGFEHHQALQRVEAFAQKRDLPIESVAAVPVPPSPIAWSGLVRTPGGVYGGRIDTNSSQMARYLFFTDSPTNSYVEKAFRLQPVRTYMGFARFPLVRYFRTGEDHLVEFYDLRFFNYEQRRLAQHPFTYRVVFGPGGQILQQGWMMAPGARAARGFRGAP